MAIRVALAVLAAVVGTAAVAAPQWRQNPSGPAPQGRVVAPVMSCPRLADADAATGMWGGRGLNYDRAWKFAKPLGCRPLTLGEVVNIIEGEPPKPACVVPLYESACMWVPAGGAIEPLG